jgi:D-3-phosphoglycerate dehydrogenase / 2-oxoglutarate reductase
MTPETAKYKIWFERALPQEHAWLLNGVAVALEPAGLSTEARLSVLTEAEAIIASSRIKYDGNLMDRAPALRIISRTGIGIDNIVVEDATARNIAVCNTPDAPTISTAEHAVTLMLAVAKQIKSSERALQQGRKRDFFSDNAGLEVDGLCLGVIGFGRIGKRVARIALALGMRVTTYDPFVSEEQAASHEVTLIPNLAALLQDADIVSLHVPLTAQTHHMMNVRTFAEMKTGAILVNTARGGLVDESALVHALDQGRLRGAALDVFDSEPVSPEHPLLRRDNVIATPHIAGATSAGKKRLWEAAIHQALQVLRGERPLNLVNPEVWEVVGRGC